MPLPPSLPHDRTNTIRGFIQDYLNLYVNVRDTEAAVNEEMAAYEEREMKRIKDLEAKKGVADEDGFITVISTTKSHTAALDADVMSRTAQGYVYDPYARLKAALNAAANHEGPANLRTVDNFYRFQVRQKRTSELDDLKRKFEDDKRRLAELKKNKLFL